MEAELRELQQVDTQILIDVVDVLNKHNLRYFLIGGTLLGAIRHKGFIPWDDDMDIAMPRTDYDKLLELFADDLPDHLRIRNFETDSTYKYYISRVEDTRFQVKEIRNRDLDTAYGHISIDIFPIDGTPDNKFHRKLYYAHVMFLRALISLIQKENIDMRRDRGLFERLIIAVGTKLPLDKMLNANRLQYSVDKLLKKQPQNSKSAGTIMGAYRLKEIVPRKFFGEGTPISFEGRIFIGPEMWDAYLSHMYGDYMQLPSKEEQKKKRHFELVKSKIE